MSPLSVFDVTLLAGFCTLLFVGAVLSLLVLRVALIRLEDATTTYDLLREHPELRKELPLAGWTDSVNLSDDPHGFHSLTTGRAA